MWFYSHSSFNRARFHTQIKYINLNYMIRKEWFDRISFELRNFDFNIFNKMTIFIQINFNKLIYVDKIEWKIIKWIKWIDNKHFQMIYLELFFFHRELLIEKMYCIIKRELFWIINVIMLLIIEFIFINYNSIFLIFLSLII